MKRNPKVVNERPFCHSNLPYSAPDVEVHLISLSGRYLAACIVCETNTCP